MQPRVFIWDKGAAQRTIRYKYQSHRHSFMQISSTFRYNSHTSLSHLSKTTLFLDNSARKVQVRANFDFAKTFSPKVFDKSHTIFRNFLHKKANFYDIWTKVQIFPWMEFKIYKLNNPHIDITVQRSSTLSILLKFQNAFLVKFNEKTSEFSIYFVVINYPWNAVRSPTTKLNV